MTDTDDTDKSSRKRGSGGRFVYDILRDEILSLAMEPGSPIDEIQLSERFGMSRTPVREALVRLASEGLITTLPNRTAVVSSIDFLNLHAFFDALTLMYRVTTRLAGENHTARDLVEIRARQRAFNEAVAAQDALVMIAANREFHAAIARAGRNSHFESFFCRLLDEGRRLLRLYYQSFDDQLPQEYVTEHDDMIAAIAARDLDACEQIARAHADQIVRQIQAMVARESRHDFTI